MNAFDDEPKIFEISRLTPRARGLSWGGTAFFGFCLLSLGFLLKFMYSGPSSEKVLLFLGSFSAVCFIIALILWVASSNAQKGTLSISKDRISCRCIKNFIDIKPEEITSVERTGNVVDILYSGKTLTLKSNKASQMTIRLNEIIAAHQHPEKQIFAVPHHKTNGEEKVSEDKIREYKALVEEGLITQAQFEAIIERQNKHA